MQPFDEVSDPAQQAQQVEEAEKPVTLELTGEPKDLKKCLYYSSTDPTPGATWELVFSGFVLPALCLVYFLSDLTPEYSNEDPSGFWEEVRYFVKYHVSHIQWAHHNSYAALAAGWFGFLVTLAVAGPLVDHHEWRCGKGPCGRCLGSFWGTHCGRILKLGEGFGECCAGFLKRRSSESLTDPEGQQKKGPKSHYLVVAPAAFAVGTGSACAVFGAAQVGYAAVVMFVLVMVIVGTRGMCPKRFQCALPQKCESYDAFLVPGFFILVLPMVPAVWVLYNGWKNEHDQPNVYRDLLFRIGVVGVFGPISITCFWDMHRPDKKMVLVDKHLVENATVKITVEGKGDLVRAESECTLITSEEDTVELLDRTGWTWKLQPSGHPLCLDAVRSVFSYNRHLYIFAKEKTDDQYGTLFRCRVRAGWIRLQYILYDIVLQAGFVSLAVHLGANQFDSADHPCQVPVQNTTACSVPCVNMADWWHNNFTYSAQNTTFTLNSTLCLRYPEVVDIGLRFQSISLGVMLIVWALSCYSLYRCLCGFQILGDAVDAFLWQFPIHVSEDFAQKEFLGHVIQLRNCLREPERLKMLDEYYLDYLPEVPAVQQRRKSKEARTESSSRMPIMSLVGQPEHPAQETSPPEISWEWWFRYHAALQETVQWYYMRLWFILIGMVIAWVGFIMDILLTAGFADYKSAVVKDTASIIYATFFFGMPVLVAVILGSFLNLAMAASLEKIEGVVRSSEDKQYLDWAKCHPVPLRLCFFVMDHKMVGTAMLSIFSGLLLLVKSV